MENNLNGMFEQASNDSQLQTMLNGANDFSSLLERFAIPKKKREVSLSTLSEKQIEKIMRSANNGLKLARQYGEKVEAIISERLAIYNADEKHYRKLFPRLSEKTKWRSRDVQVAAEWILPGLLEAFTGGDEPIDIKGVDVEDDIKAKQLQGIVDYQMTRKNDLHSIMKFAIHDALKCNFGVVQVSWKHEEERETYEMIVESNNIELAYMLAMEQQAGRIEIKSVKPIEDAPDLLKLKYEKIKVTANYPLIEYLSQSELLFTPEAATLQDTKFVAHRKIVTGDYLKRKEQEGLYRNVDEAIKKVGNVTPTALETNNNNDLTQMRGGDLSDDDNASKYVELIEAYVDIDYNNDGITERLIVHMVDDVPLRISINEFGFVPFYPCCIEYSPVKVFSDYSFSEIIEQQQDLKTALVRQIIINVAQQNAGQKIIAPDKVDIDALIAGDEYVSVTNTEGSLTDYVYAIPTPQLSPSTMDLIQYSQSEIESQTGSTKYNQGLDSDSLNKTARGISMIMTAADKRIKLMARNIAERFYVPIAKAIILLDQKYMTDDEIVRINNENIRIRREDLDVDYDMIINVGGGAGNKETRIQYLMVFIRELIPIMVQGGVADEGALYNAAKDLLQELGMKSTIAFLKDPQDPQVMQQKTEAQQQQQALLAKQEEREDRKQQIDLVKAMLSRIQIRYDDMPISAQSKLLDYLGLGTDISEFIAKELLNDSQKNNPQSAIPKEEIQKSGTGRQAGTPGRTEPESGSRAQSGNNS